jgi:hypothetical protein
LTISNRFTAGRSDRIGRRIPDAHQDAGESPARACANSTPTQRPNSSLSR